jgi:hypothetical protein
MSAISAQQLRFWNELTQLRGQIEFLRLLHRECERVDRILKMFLAVTSSGSIAAWAIWKDFAMTWGGIIVMSQLINAIKPYLPFEKRQSSVSSLVSKLESLFVRWEGVWQQVADGELTEREISDKITEMKRFKLEFQSSCLKDDILPHKKKLEELAAIETETYFKAIYQQEEK